MELIDALLREPTPIARVANLRLVASSHTLRCDAKQAERRFRRFDEFVESVPSFALGEFLPGPLVKGSQPTYLETPDAEGVPVINTLAIQDLRIIESACRCVAFEDFEELSDERKPKKGDVLLTMDGGTSIGKPVLFDLDDDYGIDSHIAILRPDGLSPQLLVYLLASPFGQVQFQRAESGASGQTAVTEDDLRRFRFPRVEDDDLEALACSLRESLAKIGEREAKLRADRADAWEEFTGGVLDRAKK